MSQVFGRVSSKQESSLIFTVSSKRGYVINKMIIVKYKKESSGLRKGVSSFK